MTKGLDKNQLREAERLGTNRAYDGYELNEAKHQVKEAQAEVDSYSRLQKILHKDDFLVSKMILESVEMNAIVASDGHKVAESNATEHYIANVSAYQEQAVIEAQAAGVPTNFGRSKE
ncbi:MAG: hypothetical protein JWO47_1067 [Candidatus Saccharibacteria bacterium]|nr:hypothetical protein [Candidatus Saccharibacteria bacterium]